MPKISVLMPTYNAGKYITQSLESICTQTYTDWELLVVDDASTDATKEIVEEYKRKDDRIKWVNGPQRGIGAALNYGIELAKGDYVARMDADDISYPARLEKQLDYMEAHQRADICGTNYRIFNGLHKTSPVFAEHRSGEVIAAQMLFNCVIAHPTVMFRKKILDAGWRYAENVITEDYDLWTRMIPDVEFACMDEVLLDYRLEQQNTSVQVGRKTMAKASMQCVKACTTRIFQIEAGKYKDDVFTANGFAPAYNNGIEFLDEELEFLKEIDRNNRSIKVFQQSVLRDVLQERWSAMLGTQGISEDEIIRGMLFEILGKKREWEYYREIIKDKINALRAMAMEQKRIVIYGAGVRGGKYFSAFWKLIRQSKINWKLEALIDRKVDNLFLDGKQYEVQKPENLQEIKPDLVLISVKNCFTEIKADLLKMGFREEQIFSANILNGLR